MSEEVHIKEQTVIVETIKPKKKKKGLIVLVAVLLLAAIGGGGYYWKQVQEQKRAEMSIKNYKKNMTLMLATAITVGAESEDMVNQYRDVWYGAIFDGKFTPTDAITRNSSSFDTALLIQRKLYDISGKTKKLKAGLASSEEYMNKLKNPPEKYKDLYKEFVILYTTLSSFESMAEDPSGSLQSYTEQFKELDSKLSDQIKSIQIQLP